MGVHLKWCYIASKQNDSMLCRFSQCTKKSETHEQNARVATSYQSINARHLPVVTVLCAEKSAQRKWPGSWEMIVVEVVLLACMIIAVTVFGGRLFWQV
jgi:hypothetical protein